MKKIIFILILCMILTTVTGCSDDMVSKDSVFVPIKENIYSKLVYHSKTKVMYVVSKDGIYSVLVNPDGSPMLYTKKEEEE